MSEAATAIPAQSASDRFLARFEGLRRRLPGSERIREAAADRLRSVGLPTVREEDWRYTSLRSLDAVGFEKALTPVGEGDAGEAQSMLAELALPDMPRLVFVDGRFAPDLSSVPSEVSAALFGRAPVFGDLARPESETFVALNTMLAEDGAVIDIADGIDAGALAIVTLGIHATARPITYHPRHRVTLGRDARLVLVDVSVGNGIYLHNPVAEISVGAGATLTHVRMQAEDRRAFHMSTSYVDVAARGTYDSFNLVIGAALTRTEIHATLRGEGGIVHLNGAQVLSGRQHADFTTAISHVAPNCASRQTVKNVLSGHSRGVFQGRIDVAREAQKTDGYQMNQALLLSEHAEIDSKPQLRIHADDVKCSHGATVGALDEEQMFYLRSRGVPAAEAQAMLVRAFLAEAIDPITHEGARLLLERAIEGAWTRLASEVDA